MENSRIEDIVDEARELFDKQPENVETGLDVDGADLLQLRKACRLLMAANHLEEENGYYTVVIEASFASIERTFQFYLLNKGIIHSDEYVDHQMIYEKSHEAGLYNKSFKGKLLSLWQDNRSYSYYREGEGGKKRAEKMFELAEAIHNHVLQLGGESHQCICGTNSS